MKAPIKILAILLFFLSMNIQAQSNFLVHDAQMNINGTSTLHDWTSEVKEVYLEGELMIMNGKVENASNVVLRIPVKSIQSEKGRIMNNKTYDAFKSDQHPNITFRLQNLSSTGSTAGVQNVRMNGKLTMAGTTKNITLDMVAKPTNNGMILFEGKKSLNMTDYNMEPPTAMLGTISTGEEVTVNFSITLKEKPNADWSNQ